MTGEIHKYALPRALLSRGVHVPMRKDAEIIHFDVQRGVPTIWCIEPLGEYSTAVVENQRGSPLDIRTFVLLPTGALISPEMKHVGSFLENNGDYVWHVFERK